MRLERAYYSTCLAEQGGFCPTKTHLAMFKHKTTKKIYKYL